jgi:ABC-2 type transport system permease protein
MIGMELYIMARKELLLLSRDLHGLLLLFVMPLVFIVIMSLAMQDHYASRAGRPLDVLVVDHEAGSASAALLATLRRHQGYRFEVEPPDQREAALRRARRGEVAFLVEIQPELADFTAIQAGHEHSDMQAGVVIRLPAETSRHQEHVFVGLLQEAMGRLRLASWLRYWAAQEPDGPALGEEELIGMDAVATTYLYSDDPDVAPSAVQQNVPAWLIFSIFFIVVPLSNTFIQERQLGTLHRMRSMRVRPTTLVLGKMAPYFGVNQIQVVLMLLAGMYLVPWWGGDRLQLGDSWSGLMLMSVAVSWAALGYALLIAVVARTPEQAVTLGGMGNIIWAAIGGIMVPAFIMPPAMQTLSNFSPMAWALQGFLDVFLRGGGWELIWPKVSLLSLFGVVCMLLAVRLHARAS